MLPADYFQSGGTYQKDMEKGQIREMAHRTLLGTILGVFHRRPY